MIARRLVGTSCLTLTVLLLACGTPAPRGDAQSGGDSSRPAAPKRILAAIRGDPYTFADAINAAGGGRVAGVREIEQMLNAGLGVVDPQGQLRPILAETIPSVQAGTWNVMPDGRMETTWKLRQNAAWQDGTPFTAADLQFTNRIATNPNLTISQDAAFEFIDRIEAPDPHTLLVTWKSPYIEADALFTRTERSSILPMARHLLEQPYAENPLGILEHSYWTQDFIGTGAYRLKEWTSGSHMVLRASDGFVLGRPKVDEIEVKFLWDTNVVVANVLSGAVELTLGAGLSVDQALLVREQWRDGRVETPLVTLTGLWPQFINPDPPAIADIRFRRALLHAIDRQFIVDTFMGGLTPVAHSFIAPDDPDYGVIGPNVVRYEHDPARATRLIEEVGYVRGPDGAFRDATGRRVVVELRTTAHPLREQLQPVIGDYWQRVGVGLDPIIIPRQRAQDREYRATTLGFDFRFNPPDVTRYHSSKIPLPENNYRGDNNARYRSAELDGLLERYLVTIPKPERLQTLGQIIRHMTDQLVVVPLLHDAEPALMGNRLLNISPRKGDSLQPWNVHEWDVK